MITKAKVTNLHWNETATSVWEATLEVKHKNGDIQMFVIPITRMTVRMKDADTHTKTPRTRTGRAIGGRRKK